MEFWLAFNNGAEKLRLPVPPQTFELQTGAMNTTVTIHELGEVNLIGKRRLKSISLSSYFPVRDDGLCQYRGFPPPRTCVETIEQWRDSGRPIRLIVIGESVRLNEAMAIESFSYSQKRGPADIYFTLELKEYRFLNFTPAAGAADALMRSIVGEMRPAERAVPDKYPVQTGDSLLTIARKVYGDSSRWRELMSRNGLRDENELAPGKVLLL